MKRGMFCISLLLAFGLLFLPVIPARAAMEYGAIYDESGLLWTEEAEELGTERFPQFTESYRIDLRVDVLTSIGEFENLAQAAEYLFPLGSEVCIRGGKIRRRAVIFMYGKAMLSTPDSA